MMMKAIAFAALVAISAGASALTTSWGPHDPAELGSNFVQGSGSLINDIYTFSLASASNTTSVSVTNDGAGGVFDLQNGKLSLFSGVPSTGTLIGSLSFDAAPITHGWGTLAAGNYYYQVTAQVVSTALAGSYLLSSTLAQPVPEPESYALMLAGLAGVGFVAARRNKVR